MSPLRSWLRFSLVVALVAAAEIFLVARSRPEILPSRPPLSSFPLTIDTWSGRDVAIPQEFLDVLGPGEFLQRIYNSSSTQPYVDLFLAYFPSQKTGDTIHSPKNCLPGSGWTPIESGRVQLTQASDPPIDANRYILEKGSSRLFVLYWYQAHGRAVASEYWAKYFLVADAIRMNRTDGALVRVITPVLPDENVTTSERRAVGFTGQFLPVLDRYIPR